MLLTSWVVVVGWLVMMEVVTVLRLDGFQEVSPILRGGVYALAKDGVVVYVGKSKRMLARIETHRSQWGRKSSPAWLAGIARGILFDQVFIRPCAPDAIDALEAEMINLYKPRYNVRIKTPASITSPFTIHIGDIPLPFNIPSAPITRFHRRF